jgi:hypothetical protein
MSLQTELKRMKSKPLSKRARQALLAALLLLPMVLQGTPPAPPDTDTLRGWIREMKVSARGPFARIRWFCRDGTRLPPASDACEKHGGGVQHGEWSEKTLAIRAAGYQIATVLADIEPQSFLATADAADTLRQMLLEQFLISADDGWILREARFYRGAFQPDDEARSGRALLLAMGRDAQWRRRNFATLREAARWLPHGGTTARVTQVRSLSNTLAADDSGFEALRNKIHVRPDAEDAARVRAYAARRGTPALATYYRELAQLIDAVYHIDRRAELDTLAGQMRTPGLGAALRDRLKTLGEASDPAARLHSSGQLLAALRDHLSESDRDTLPALDASLLLETETFAAASALRPRLASASRRTRLVWLDHLTEALYGTGLLSRRQRDALQQSLAKLRERDLPVSTYRAEVQYLTQATRWADRRLRLDFGETLARFQAIEPLAARYADDRLRASPLLVYAEIADGMLRDANRLAGIRHTVFGETVVSGLHPLNPGLARGPLYLADSGVADPHGIYIVPEVTAELPPVAGILTRTAGNAVSHVQLLARNLGIPNVVVDEALMGVLQRRLGQSVVLAVSPKGIVRIFEDGPQWDSLFSDGSGATEPLLQPDLARLDLATRRIIPLEQMREEDAGRRAGPKAAHLGELKYRYPQAVGDGLVIPFGVFNALLDRPVRPEGPSMRQWIADEHWRLAAWSGDRAAKPQAVAAFLEAARDWIHHTDPGQAFREQLRAAMQTTFGEDGTYGVFVRSDTNVEDLPGFTGAGLNLTVPNVISFERVLEAIQQVWASPFTERAYGWRQASMNNPVEDVYPSVLLLRSVPVEKSGVLVTVDIDTGRAGSLSIAVNEGIGGAVAGQLAEELRVDVTTGEVRLLAEAAQPTRQVLRPGGGLERVPASGGERVLTDREIERLMMLAADLPRHFASLRDAAGVAVPADVEFGFLRGELKLFQVRPFAESKATLGNAYLIALDRALEDRGGRTVTLDQVP